MTAKPEATPSAGPLRNVAVRMRDGTIVAVDVRLPADGYQPWPAVVCATPYSKDLVIGPNFGPCLRELAENGYAAVMADLRGTGASEGVKREAFEIQEISDMYDLVQGIGEMPWCNGRVGVWGVSYGGITAFKAAASAAPNLRAIVAVEGSLDPYMCEVMRYGAQGMAMIRGEWAGWMLAMCALPPAFGVPSGRADLVWAEHLRNLTPWQRPWREHSSFDRYWQRKVTDPAAIAVPALVITSWQDTNPWIWDDLPRFGAPAKVICGPWLHGLPDRAEADSIDSMTQMLRWWDRWLRDEDNGVENEPRFSTFVMQAGNWESFDRWPPATTELILIATGDMRAVSQPPPTSQATVLPVPFHATVGSTGGIGMSAAPGDQAEDDAKCLVWQTNALPEAVEIAGQVRVKLTVHAGPGAGDILIRVLDLGYDEASRLVTKGFARLSPPGETAAHGDRATVEVTMNPIRYRIGAGHRLRFALSRANFPEIWPTDAGGAAMSVVLSDQQPFSMTIPVLAAAPDRSALQFGPGRKEIQSPVRRSSSWDVQYSGSGRAAVTAGFDSSFDDGSGLHVACSHFFTAETNDAPPLRPALSTRTRIAATARGTSYVVTARTQESAAELRCQVDVSVDGQPHYSRTFTDRESGTAAEQSAGINQEET
jgi:predicted acyl esterase